MGDTQIDKQIGRETEKQLLVPIWKTIRVLFDILFHIAKKWKIDFIDYEWERERERGGERERGIRQTNRQTDKCTNTQKKKKNNNNK